jgi:hypothetical protein
VITSQIQKMKMEIVRTSISPLRSQSSVAAKKQEQQRRAC